MVRRGDRQSSGEGGRCTNCGVSSRKKRKDRLGGLGGLSVTLNKGDISTEKVISRSQDANNKLVFFEGCYYAFDLEDLLEWN
ncbi:hypothetical protein L484_018437 [Morus notabilis]|uniref:Uncharacterized protein n=1 Tax=Morus notabilis TaxID=981085 RepID=W9QD76_9ROSA|nr:hypothetical protein L484_018437 [Morus notabilis]